MIIGCCVLIDELRLMKVAFIGLYVNKFNQIAFIVNVLLPVLPTVVCGEEVLCILVVGLDRARRMQAGGFWQQLIESAGGSCYFFGSIKDHHGCRQSAIFNYLPEEDP